MRYNNRDVIYKNKKKFKGTKISAIENLTATRMRILQKAREEHKLRNVWTQYGKILFWDLVSDRVQLYYY